MTTYKRELSNLSYTNKDFAQIYPELLDLAKKISYKWDPSTSDESDPGVVLLKFAALMADKCNYNIDKNVLELFPASVTQMPNARQIFEQCGYTMRHYQSATTMLTFRLLNEPDLTDNDIVEITGEDKTVNDIKGVKGYERTYILPRFTMFSDTENSIVYTVTDDIHVMSDGSATNVDAIQGAINEYNVDGATTITYDMLDENNRLYFTGLNIPENGIFISNIESQFSEMWKKVDNLYIQPLGTRCYKFGLTLDGNRCFIEFPSDVSTLMERGLQIFYVTTAGYEGNIGRHVIRQFFTDATCKRRLGQYTTTQDVSVTSDNIHIINEDAVLNGKNPETIDEAYRNYQKVKTTFETLVSTQDYSNFFETNKSVSRCVVCDRSNDPQSSYTVLSKVDGEYHKVSHVRSTAEEKTLQGKLADGTPATISVTETAPEMTAFDLRVYGLAYHDGFTDYSSFSKSFDVINVVREYSSIVNSSADIKCIAHDYIPFEKDRIILLKNRYPLTAKLISTHKLAPSQQNDILQKVKSNLYQLLNSQKLAFGEEIDYNLVYNTILTSDPRITAVILDEIRYETYAVYFSSMSNAIQTMRIDSQSLPPESTVAQEQTYLQNLWREFRTEIYTRCVLNGNTPLFIPENTFIYSLSHEQIEGGESKYTIDEMSTGVSIPLTYYPDPASNTYVLLSRTLKPNDVITLTSPNLIMDQRYSSYCKYITNIGLELDENGRSIRPEYDEASNDPRVVVRANTDYVLQPHEYIIFFWRSTNSETEPYTYVKYTGRDESVPTIITPSFDIVAQPHTAMLATGVAYKIDDEMFMSLGDFSPTDLRERERLTIDPNVVYDAEYTIRETLTDYTVPEIKLNNFIYSYIAGKMFNTDTENIEVKKINEIHLNNIDTGTTKFYWILNKTVTDANGKEWYRLFSADPTDCEYTLKEGEQLLYSNPKLTQLYVLGTGTKITRVPANSAVECTSWDCPALTHKLEYLQEGPRYFENSDHRWFNINERAAKFNLYATEMLYRKIAEGTRLRIELPSALNPKQQDRDYFITSDGVVGTVSGASPDKESSIILDNDPEFQFSWCSFRVTDDSGVDESLANRHHPLLAWKCTSSLSLNMSVDAPQRLYSNQVLQWLTSDSKRFALAGSDEQEFMIQSDRPIVMAGGTNLDVRYYDILTETYKPLELYMYKMKDIDLSSDSEANSYNIPWQFSSSAVTGSGDNITLHNVLLPEGDYILPVNIQNLFTGYDYQQGVDYTAETDVKNATNSCIWTAGVETVKNDSNEDVVVYTFTNSNLNLGMSKDYSSMSLGGFYDTWLLHPHDDNRFAIENVARKRYMRWADQYGYFSTLVHNPKAELELEARLQIYVLGKGWLTAENLKSIASGDRIVIVAPDYNKMLSSTPVKYESRIDTYWNRLRPMSSYKLNDQERAVISDIQQGLQDSALDNDNFSDWSFARQPILLHDVAKWIYSTAGINVNQEFRNHTVETAISALFVKQDVESIDSDGTGITSPVKYIRISSAAPEYDPRLGRMLTSYGGSLMLDTLSTDFEIGDVIGVSSAPPESPSVELPNVTEVWVVAGNIPGGRNFIRVRDLQSGSYNCARETQETLQESLDASLIYFVLRPSAITNAENPEGQVLTPCKTVTGVVPKVSNNYYFLLHSDGTSNSYNLQFKNNIITPEDKLAPLFEIGSPIRYSKPYLTEESSDSLVIFDDVVKLIAKLDTDSLFDFTYVVPDEDLVEYPLDPVALLNYKHPFNKFTICQYIIRDKTTRDDLIVVTKSR